MRWGSGDRRQTLPYPATSCAIRRRGHRQQLLHLGLLRVITQQLTARIRIGLQLALRPARPRERCSDSDREGGVSGFAKIGGTLRQNILLGVEMNGWTKSEGTGRVTMGNMSGAAYWYPMPTQGLFIKAGAGYSNLRADDGVTSANDGGFGVLAGVGYDVRVGRKLSITPVANWYRGGFNGGSANVLDIGL